MHWIAKKEGVIDFAIVPNYDIHVYYKKWTLESSSLVHTAILV